MCIIGIIAKLKQGKASAQVSSLFSSALAIMKEGLNEW